MLYVLKIKIREEKQADNSSLPGLPGMARKRLPAFSTAPLPWLVAPAIAGAEFDSSTKNEHETYTRSSRLFTQEGYEVEGNRPRSKAYEFLFHPTCECNEMHFTEWRTKSTQYLRSTFQRIRSK